MRSVAEIVSVLESRGTRLWVDDVGLKFDAERADLQPGDPALLGELALEREQETVEFLLRRSAVFGQYAALFRSCVYRIWNSPSLLPFLRERAPKLYAELTVRLPDEVQRLWEEGASIERFTRAIADLERVRSIAVSFYSACLPEGGERSSDGR